MLAVGVLASSSALAADRLTDRDVKALADRIDEGRNHFEDALDSKLKHDVFRGPGGEVDVERFLKDFKDNVDKFKDRLKTDYAASAEAATVLRQGSAVDRFFRQQPPGTKGESEWNRLATDLGALAGAYGTTFPLSEGAQVRRMGDGEVATNVGAIAESADDLKKALDSDLKKDTTVDKPTREGIVNEANELKKDAKTLEDRVKDGQPSSAEAARLFDRASRIQSFLDAHKPPSATGAWAAVASRLRAVSSAYGTAWPAAR